MMTILFYCYKPLRLFFITISTLLLSSCTLLSPVKVNSSTKYMINVAPPYVSTSKAKKHKITLLVFTPETEAVYNTTQMAYSTHSHQIAYFSKNEWAETPSQMLQPLLAQTLRNTHYFHAVVNQPFIGRYDYILNTQILQLKQNFTCYPARLELKINAQLIKVSTNRIVATQLFYVQLPMAQQTPYAGVAAANHAAERILREIALFCVNHVK